MFLLNEANSDVLCDAATGWDSLASSPAWRDIVTAVREAVQHVQHVQPVQQRDRVPKKLEGDALRASLAGTCEDGREEMYGWISRHEGDSTHAAHAHLDAAISAGQLVTYLLPYNPGKAGYLIDDFPASHALRCSSVPLFLCSHVVCSVLHLYSRGRRTDHLPRPPGQDPLPASPDALRRGYSSLPWSLQP